jgi:hypothetical protein
VILLDAETKPYQPDELKIKITDSHGAVVSEGEISRKEFTGVFSGMLKLSDTPPLGQWSITAKAEKGEEVIQTFEVSEYVLPRFSVTIQSDDHVLLSEKKMKVFFHGDYTFGEFVEGNATISAKTATTPDKLEASNTTTTKTARVAGKKHVDFDFTRDLKLRSSAVVQIIVTVEEKSTGIKASASKIVFVHKTAKKTIELITNDNKLKPGFPMTVRAIVRTFDGSLETSTERVKFKIVFTQSRPKNAEKMSRLRMEEEGEITTTKSGEVDLKDGIAEWTFDVPSTAMKATVSAKCLDVGDELTVMAVHSKSKAYLKVEVVEER